MMPSAPPLSVDSSVDLDEMLAAARRAASATLTVLLTVRVLPALPRNALGGRPPLTEYLDHWVDAFAKFLALPPDVFARAADWAPAFFPGAAHKQPDAMAPGHSGAPQAALAALPSDWRARAAGLFSAIELMQWQLQAVAPAGLQTNAASADTNAQSVMPSRNAPGPRRPEVAMITRALLTMAIVRTHELQAQEAAIAEALAAALEPGTAPAPRPRP